VAAFVEADVAKGDKHKRASRRDALRRRLGRYLNWSAKLWGHASQISAVRVVKKEEIERERGTIHYHAATEISAALEKLPSPYWNRGNRRPNSPHFAAARTPDAPWAATALSANWNMQWG